MNDERADAFCSAHDDHALRRLLSSAANPLPAPHPPEHRRMEIHAAIHSAWFTGAPPTPDDLNRNPHPVDRWDSLLARPGPDVETHWPSTFGSPRWGGSDDRPGDDGPA